MTTLTNLHIGAAGSRFWDVVVDGRMVATLQHGSEAFAKWYVSTVDRTYDFVAFPSKAAALTAVSSL